MVDVFPTAWVVQRLGRSPGKVALTFDDGPDPRWTPKILDILKQKNAKATFFVIGRNMEDYPELVTREVAEGHAHPGGRTAPRGDGGGLSRTRLSSSPPTAPHLSQMGGCLHVGPGAYSVFRLPSAFCTVW